MAGVPAGTLSIEIVAEIARLQEDMRKVQQVVGGAADGVGKSAKAINDNFSSVNKSAGQTRAGMQQLSYQLGDVATQFSMGQKPMQIFAAQASQIVGALGLMTSGSKGFIAFLGGPWGQIIIGAATVLGTLAAAMWDTKATADKTTPAIDRLGNAYANLAANLGKVNFAGVQARAEAQQKLMLDQTALAKARMAVTVAEGRLAASRRVDPRGQGSAPLTRAVAAARAEAQYLETQVRSAEGLVKLGEERFKQTQAATAAEEAATAAKKAGALAAKARNKELRETERLARSAAKEAETLAKWLAGTRMEAQGNVQSLYADMVERQREWQNDLPTFTEQEADAAEAAARVREGQLENEQRLLNVYLQQVDAIRQMGGLFEGVGGILDGLATGNFMNMRGKIGGLLGTIGGISTGVMAESKFGAAGNALDEPEKIGETIADHLTAVFRENGEFFKSFKNVMANAAIGSTAAGLAGGSKLGGGIGGAIGGFLTGKNGPFGKALESGLNSVFQGLGSFAGPLGSIAGGLLGGALGGLFKPKPKYASAGLFMNEYGELAGGTAKGNAGSAIRAASGIASNVADGLNSLAEQLGAKITGVPNIKVGTYDGKYRVNVEGRGGKMDFKGNSAKGLYNFGDDEQAAIEFAIQKSIEGAVLTGISQASINILKSGQDLQKAIEKATLIEDIPRELQRRLDPVGYAIDELNKKWMRTVDALREGEATSQQMAAAQKLYNMELAEVKENAGTATQAMKDFLKAMNMGSSSPLSLREQAANARGALDPFLAQINAGQSINQDKYLEAAQTYLDIERQMYGSTAKYFEAFDAIQAATNKAIATVDNAAPIRTTSDPFIEQTAAATKSMEANTANTVTLLEKQNTLLEDLLAKVGSNGGQFTGSVRNYG